MFCIFNIFTFDKKEKEKRFWNQRDQNQGNQNQGDHGPMRSNTNEIKDQGDQGSMFWSNPWLRLPIEKVGRID